MDRELSPIAIAGATKVLWSRIDQKTCFKAIKAAGLEPIVIEPLLTGDQLDTDVGAFARELEGDPETILAIVSTTSAFAPRGPDDIEALARLAAKHNVPHLINNAYGLQVPESMNLLTDE